jgi:hypothetical protein
MPVYLGFVIFFQMAPLTICQYYEAQERQLQREIVANDDKQTTLRSQHVQTIAKMFGGDPAVIGNAMAELKSSTY